MATTSAAVGGVPTMVAALVSMLVATWLHAQVVAVDAVPIGSSLAAHRPQHGHHAGARWYASDTLIPPVAELVVSNGTGPNSVYFQAEWQTDCELVLYRLGTAYWSTLTAQLGNHLCYLAMQRDGNLVVLGDDKTPIWASNSTQTTTGDYYAQLQVNGDFVVYSPDGTQAIWNSATNWW